LLNHGESVTENQLVEFFEAIDFSDILHFLEQLKSSTIYTSIEYERVASKVMFSRFEIDCPLAAIIGFDDTYDSEECEAIARKIQTILWRCGYDISGIQVITNKQDSWDQ
jgi:hypothetical protein